MGTKITALTAGTAVTTDDILPFVDAPGGTPATKKITAANLLQSLLNLGTGLTALTAPIATDLIFVVDDPTGTPVVKKVALGDAVALRACASANFTSNGDTTLSDITGMSVTVTAGKQYIFIAHANGDNDGGDATGGGVKFAIGGTATITSMSVASLIMYGTSTPGTRTISEDNDLTALGESHGLNFANNNDFTLDMAGMLLINAAGTITLQTAQHTSASNNCDIYGGAYILLIPVG